MKAGLITIYHVPNYGSVLQAFATQYLLERLGAECRIINYKYPNEWHWSHGGVRPGGWKYLFRRIIPSKKTLVLKRFRNDYLNLTSIHSNLEELIADDWSSYDVFVVGSDQVWNARFVLGDSAFLLSFVPNDKVRCSLASSFALKSLPEQFRDKYRAELSKFDALSVRECNGVGIIHNELQINKPVEIILDPTLLLSKDDWLRAIRRSSFKKEKPYIVLYMWTYAFEPRPYIFDVVDCFQKKMGCDIFALEGYTKLKISGLRMKDKSRSSIEEFIDIFSHADLVVTSSFHGTAFALNFGIPLISIVPDGDSDDRQMTLLRNAGCEQCAVRIGSPIDSIKPQYDVYKEQIRLDQLRQSNLQWIIDNIYDKANNQ